MARTKAGLSAGARLADYLTVGVLAMQCPLIKVKQALDKNAKPESVPCSVSVLDNRRMSAPV